MRFDSLAAYRQTTIRSGSDGIATPTFSKRAGWLRMKKLPANWNGFENLFGSASPTATSSRRPTTSSRRRGRGFSTRAHPRSSGSPAGRILGRVLLKGGRANHIVVGGLTVRHTGLLAAPVCIEEATFRRGASRCEPRLAPRYRRFGRAHLLVRFCPKSDLRFCQNPKRSNKKLQTLN